MEKLEEKSWIPIEASPGLLTKLAVQLGFPIVDLAFYDILSLDADVILSTVPTPVAAVIVVFPMKDCHKELRNQQYEDSKSETTNLVFIKERIQNGCGTFALLHAVLNVKQYMANSGYSEGSFLDNFVICNIDASSEEMSQYLINDTEIEKLHQEIALQGKSSIENSVGSHFITFVEVDGKVYELDGRMPGPICKGEVEGINLAVKVSTIINEYMNMDPEEIKFSAIALAQNYGTYDF